MMRFVKNPTQFIEQTLNKPEQTRSRNTGSRCADLPETCRMLKHGAPTFRRLAERRNTVRQPS